MMKIKAGTPAYEGYQAAVTFAKDGTETTCPYDHDTPEFDEWSQGYRQAVEDVDLLDKLDEPIGEPD